MADSADPSAIKSVKKRTVTKAKAKAKVDKTRKNVSFADKKDKDDAKSSDSDGSDDDDIDLENDPAAALAEALLARGMPWWCLSGVLLVSDDSSFRVGLQENPSSH